MRTSSLRRISVSAMLLILLSGKALPLQKTEPSPADQAVIRAKASAGKATAPRPIYRPDPEYSTDARKNNVQGEVILALTVEADGTTSNVKVKKSLRSDLDQNAVEAVKRWKFVPATKDGKPVAMNVNIAVKFLFYKD